VRDGQSEPRSASGADAESHASYRPGQLVARWLAWWVVGAGLWMVLDDTTLLPELIDGAVAAAIGATAATVTMTRSPLRFGLRLAWLRWWWRPLRQFAGDLPALVGHLSAALRGGDRDPGDLRAVPFRVDPDGSKRAAQVALASVAGSFAPNSIVVAIDEAAGLLIVHQLSVDSTRAGADPLGLG